MDRRLGSQLLFAILFSIFPSLGIRADLLVTRPVPVPGNTNWPAVLRFSESTGAFITNFTYGRYDEEMEGGTFGPDGNLYVTVNDLGYGAVLRHDGATGKFLNEFVPLNSGGLSVLFALKFKNGGDLFVGGMLYTNGQFGPGRILRYNGTNGALSRGLLLMDQAGCRVLSILFLARTGTFMWPMAFTPLQTEA